MNNLTIDINGTCNIDCDFCYQKLDGSELTVNEVLQFIKQKNPSIVELGGGEPLLHKGLFEILRQIANNNKKAHLSTNATFIPKGLLDLEESIRNSTTVQVSLHAGNAELYRKITGYNLFDKVVNNLEEFKKKFKTQINTVVYQKNIKNISQILDIAEGLEVPLRVNLVMPKNKGKNVKLINHRQKQELKSYLFQQKRTRKIVIDSPFFHFNNCPILTNNYNMKQYGNCKLGCGIREYISPQGKTNNCQFMD